MGYYKTWWMSWVGDENKPIRFWLRSGFKYGPSVDTKRKLFSLAEVCPLPYAVLVLITVFLMGGTCWFTHSVLTFVN